MLKELKLRELIKSLAIEQKALKPARKTGTYKCTWVAGWACITDNLPEVLTKAWTAASKIQDNRLKITAALNLYHEERKSEYRHGVEKGDIGRYQRYVKEITDALNVPFNIHPK